MTSDRGRTGDSEMQLAHNPVTPPKSAGLNPNAHVFESKSPSTPPDVSTEWQEGVVPGGEMAAEVVTSLPTDSNGYIYMNGTMSEVAMPTGVLAPAALDVVEGSSEYGEVNGVDIEHVSPPSIAMSDTASVTDESVTFEDNKISDEQLRSMLKNQLEYYFSRENLANDSYLASQMDPDKFVPIATIAGFNQVKRLTNDLSLVVDVLRESTQVQVDEKGEKVRPMHKRCVVILREIPQDTPLKDVADIFSGASCPRFVSCEFAHNNSWYVTFECETDAHDAYQYLREQVQTFLGRPIMARIKAKPQLGSSFISKNGYKGAPHHPPVVTPQQQPSYPAAGIYAQMPTMAIRAQHQSAGHIQQVAPVQAQQATQLSHQPKFTYNPQMAASMHYVGQQNFPFFPPSTGLPMWSTNPLAAYFDPGTAFAANGYTPTATFKLANANRHSINTSRNRNMKPHRSGMRESNDRMQERHQMSSGTAVRNGRAVYDVGGLRRNEHHGVHASTVVQGQDSGYGGGGGMRHTADGSARDQQTRKVYRSRRKKVHDDDAAKRSLSTSSQSSKENQPSTVTGNDRLSTKFELEDTSFPPLPGVTNNASSGDVFENKMSDVVKGTAKPSVSVPKEPIVSTVPVATVKPSQCLPSSPPPSAPPQRVVSPVKEVAPLPPPPLPTKVSSSCGGSTVIAHTPVVAKVSPQKVNRSTSTEETADVGGSTAVTVATTKADLDVENTNTTVSTQTVSMSKESPKPVAKTTANCTTSPTAPVSSVPRLSYAQMAQRGKERVAAAAVIDPPAPPASPPPPSQIAAETPAVAPRKEDPPQPARIGGRGRSCAKESREWERPRTRMPFRERRWDNREPEAARK